MTIALDVSSDLASVVDHVQTVTVRHAVSGASTTVAGALARPIAMGEARPSGGRYTADDVRWHLPTGVLNEPLAPGDEIITADETAWIVQEVKQVGLNARLQCVARKLQIVAGATDLVRLQIATWTKSAAGAPVVAWDDVLTDVAARIQPHRGEIVIEHNKKKIRLTHEIYLDQPVTIDSNHRIIDAAGNPYALVGYTDPQRIDRLTAILAVVKE